MENSPEFLETGVPQLDRILGGGLLPRSLVMVVGAPGTGKTVLAQQIAFHLGAQGRTTLYLTGYSETHDKLLSHIRGFGFFTPELVGAGIQFASLLDLLRDGVDETEDAIVAMARSSGASLLIVDGFRGIRGFLADDSAHFLYSLGAKLALLGATTLVILEGDVNASSIYPELTVCDVVLTLRHERRDGRARRLLEVSKSRGSESLEGTHPFTIGRTGLTVFPRFESAVTRSDPAWSQGRTPFGVGSLDALIGGGLTAGTLTLVAGTPGVGKTLLGLQFLAQGVQEQEPVLFLGFQESEAQLREKARVFGMDLRTAEASGLFRFLVLPGHDLEADFIGSILVQDIERRGVRRLVIDSAAELERSPGARERSADFLSALASYLRARDVTSYLTLDIPLIVGPTLEFTGTPLSVFAENLLLIRQVEYRGVLHRVFSVLKMRFSEYEPAIYEIKIVEGSGIQIAGPAPLGEGLLTGVPRVSIEPPDQSSPGGESSGAPWQPS